MNLNLLFQCQSTLILALLLVGVYWRRNRVRHVKIMLTGIAWDVLLILQIELSRKAINQTIHFTQNKILLNIHILIAISTVVLYCIMLMTGKKVLKNKEGFQKKHKFFAYLTMFMRIATYATSFLVMQ